MKKIFTISALIFVTAVSAQINAFKGADFENFSDFTASLNSYGIKSFAVLDSGQGVLNSNALKIAGTPEGNDYVFTAKATETLPEKIKEITIMVKGKAGKSLSFNLYKTDGSAYKFNVGDLSKDTKVEISDNNSYAGSIDTDGKFVKVTLVCKGLADINKNSANNFLAIKVGKGANYALDIDDIKVVADN